MYDPTTIEDARKQLKRRSREHKDLAELSESKGEKLNAAHHYGAAIALREFRTWLKEQTK